MAKNMKEMVQDARSNVSVAEPQDAYKASQGADIILDVREPDEVAEAKVPGSLCIPRGVLEAKADPEMEGHDRTLVEMHRAGCCYVLCASGGRATLAAQTLKQMGYEACVIEGGMNAWKEAGLPVED